MTVQHIETKMRAGEGFVHLCTWKDSARNPRRIIVFIHGLMMHGRSFDAIASQLAARDTIVFAPDLRGFGRSYFGDDEQQRGRANYLQSLHEISVLLVALKDRYDLPLFCAGESLGAHAARDVVTTCPEVAAGLILSSPCVRPRMVSVPLIPHACSQLLLPDWIRSKNLI